MKVLASAIIAAIGAACLSPADAQTPPPEISLEKFAEIATKMSNLEAKSELILCLLLADSAEKQSCVEKTKDVADMTIGAAQKVPVTAATGQVGTDVQALQAQISTCVGHMDSYVSKERDRSAIAEFEKSCSHETVSNSLEKTGASLRVALNECSASADSLEEFVDGNKSKPVLDLIQEAVRRKDLHKGAESCIENLGKAADSVRESTKKFETALSSTLAFCTAVPEPYSCGIFAAIQLLMALFESGGGGGSGDGDGTESGQGDSSTSVSKEKNDYAEPGQGGSPELQAKVETGGDCVVERKDDDLECGAILRAPNYFSGAGFSYTSSTDSKVRGDIDKALDDARNNLDRLFASTKLILRGNNEMQFCVNVMPGLDGIFNESREFQKDRAAEDIRTAVRLTPDAADLGVYKIKFDHSGQGCF